MGKSLIFNFWLLLVIIFTLLFSEFSKAEILKIGIIDSGIARDLPVNNLCKNLSQDFTGSKKKGLRNKLNDELNHGTRVYQIINTLESSYKNEYCVVVYKVFNSEKKDKMHFVQKALYAAIRDGVDVLNLSWSGLGSNKKEEALIKILLDKGVIIVAAAGNDSTNMNIKCEAYPSCYDKRIIAVSNMSPSGKLDETSNHAFGRTNFIGALGSLMVEDDLFQGTSAAAPVVTRLIIRTLLQNRKKTLIDE